MSKSLPKKLCSNTAEAVLFVTKLDDEECDKTIDEIDEELSEVDLLLPENDDLTESVDSEEESEDQPNHGDAHGRPRFFRSRIQNRLVSYIDSALDK